MKKVLNLILIGMIMLASGILTSCNENKDDNSTGENDKMIVAVSIVPQAAFVEAICGDLVDVVTLVPPGNSPGNYEPTPQQMTQISDASVYFTIGIPTETANIIPEIPDVKVVSLSEVSAEKYPDRTFSTGGRDPHIWLSPKRVKLMVQTIADEISNLDEDNKETYQKNAQDYIAELDAVDKEITEIFEGISDKTFIAYHPAYGYYADEYGLTMYPLEEGGKEVTPEQLQEIIDMAKEKNIKRIYYQPEISSEQVEAFAEEIDAETVQLEPLSKDYINNLRDMAKTLAEDMK